MEHLSAAGHEGRRASGDAESTAPRDLRDWIERAEAIGQIRRIHEPVDWNEEMGAITYMAHQEIGAPAPLFENITGCPKGFRSLWNIIGSSVDRFALAVGEPPGLSTMDLIQRCRGKFTRTLPPLMVEADAAPVNAHHRYGDDVDITIFPAARHWPGDGGR
jgi:4-hydroxy-3-polyprenylbenzoate decarboxylase